MPQVTAYKKIIARFLLSETRRCYLLPAGAGELWWSQSARTNISLATEQVPLLRRNGARINFRGCFRCCCGIIIVIEQIKRHVCSCSPSRWGASASVVSVSATLGSFILKIIILDVRADLFSPVLVPNWGPRLPQIPEWGRHYSTLPADYLYIIW